MLAGGTLGIGAGAAATGLVANNEFRKSIRRNRLIATLGGIGSGIIAGGGAYALGASGKKKKKRNDQKD